MSKKPISACLLDCQNAVKDKNYDAALDALKRAQQVAHKDCKSDHVNILDHRVAVYLTMESLDLALKDAKLMIRNDRTDGRGYLRCGQVERLLGNQTAAINWYKQGLKRVPSTHRMFPSLQKQLDKVESQVKKDVVLTKATDPMLALPLETVELILSFLNYKEIIGMIRVSRSWNKLFCGLPPLIDTIDYGAANKPVTAYMVRGSLRKLRIPRSIIATRMNPTGRASLLKYLQLAQSLQHLSHLELKLDSCRLHGLPWSKYNLKSLVLSGLYNRDAIGFDIGHVGIVLRDCPRLEVLSVHNLGGPGSLSAEDLHCSALRRLILHSPTDGRSHCSISVSSTSPDE